jgi:hypothetical protein
MRFPTGLIVDVFFCQDCGVIISIGRVATVEGGNRIVAPSGGDVKKLGLN